MFSGMRALTFLIAALVLLSVDGKRCTKRPIPFPQDLVGQSAAFFKGCKSYHNFPSEVKITRWALLIKSSGLYGEGGPVCHEAVVVPYNKADMPVMLYHRTARVNDVRSCIYSTKKAFVWGRSRKEFIRLIGWAAEIAVNSRQYDICGFVSAIRSYTFTEVTAWLKHDRVCNAAINYLIAISYRNFFTIDPFALRRQGAAC